MASTLYCGHGDCADCITGCKADASMPCSPDCPNLDGNYILVSKCIKERCDALPCVFGIKEDMDDPNVMRVLQSMGDKIIFPGL